HAHPLCLVSQVSELIGSGTVPAGTRAWLKGKDALVVKGLVMKTPELLSGLAGRWLSGLVVPQPPSQSIRIPAWLTCLHLMFLAAVVAFAHHPDVFFGIFMLFLGLTTATREYQEPLKLREGLLVGFFLAGLVTLGDLQRYWLQPLISDRPPAVLFFGATALTAITDNAALTYLGTLVEGLTENLKYALVAGAVCGGGLTVIANAPNPAGVGILQSARAFQPSGISPVGLLLGSLWPTAVAIVFFWLVG
ncbi:MAG: putative Na+/H+ antiporter, partial [Planctomycetaceae bacterium]